MNQENVKYCPNCGTPFVPPQKFCIQCGQQLPDFAEENTVVEPENKPNKRHVMGKAGQKAPDIADETPKTFYATPEVTSADDETDDSLEETRTFTPKDRILSDDQDDYSDDRWDEENTGRLFRTDQFNDEFDDAAFMDDDMASDTFDSDDTADYPHLERETDNGSAAPWQMLSGYADKLKVAAKGMADTVKNSAQGSSNRATKPAKDDTGAFDNLKAYDSKPSQGMTSAEKMLWLGRGSMVVAWMMLLLGAFSRLSLFMVVLFLVSHFLSKYAMKRYTLLSGDSIRIYRLIWKIQWTIFVVMVALLAIAFAVQFITTSFRTSMNYALSQFHWPNVSAKELIDTVINQIKGLFGGGGSAAIPNATSTSQPLFEQAGSASSSIGQ
ncbi:MAG: hypothetical protein Q4A67_03135 [Aerococcus sp.]|nr:hypothetical protein [Aerococcus sp.]